MKTAPALLAALLWAPSLPSAGAHITDRLLAGLFSEPDNRGEPVQLLESGTPVDPLGEEEKGFIRVRLSDGTTGWVQRDYITEEKPARVRLLELQARTTAVKKRLRAAQQELEDARERIQALGARSAELERRLAEARPPPGGSDSPAQRASRDQGRGLWIYAALAAALGLGFAAGVAWVDHRLRKRFGGFRV